MSTVNCSKKDRIREVIFMKDSKNKSAKLMAKALDGVLRAEANSTSCFIVYQPKAPKSLEKFRKGK